MSDAIHSPSPNIPRAQPRNRIILFCLIAWTVIVVLALWWLLRPGASDSGAAAWVLHEDDSPKALADRALDWFKLAHLNFQRIYPWILFAPYVAWLAWKFSVERGRLRLSLPVHLAACAAFAATCHFINSRASRTVARVVIVSTHRQADLAPAGEETKTIHVEVSGAASGTLDGPSAHQKIVREEFNDPGVPGKMLGLHEDFSNLGLTNLLSDVERAIKNPAIPAGPLPLRPLSTLLDLLAYGAIVGIVHSVHFYRRFRERERRALFLESNLAKARLNALQAQLQPHFLFNTLNAIATLLRRDPRTAEATLTSLSELLRLTLSQSGLQEMTLREELEFLQHYLEIQQTRFGDRLGFEQDIEPAALECLVPTLLLQPLVENAIRHGLEPLDQGGTVRVVARAEGGVLGINVEDSGVGLGKTAAPASCVDPGVMTLQYKPGTGIGLLNLKTRLEALYGTRQKLLLTSRPEGGTVVRIEIPWHVEATTAAPMLVS